MLVVHPAAGKHGDVVRQRVRLLADGAGIQGVGTFAHQPVKCRGPRLPELLDGMWVKAVDRDRDHSVDRIVGRLIGRSSGDNRSPSPRGKPDDGAGETSTGTVWPAGGVA